ncbi:two-component system sensor histidine kinase [Bifidobacterium dolichotidis]|uniref:histidine kinase n=1 Tax=Bifidobacterium dolichotidis TaxID=2306976 RepID=A0A430FSL3_9BIFI|nr:HAMP domain-containing sensor histidine kinase [Bifidobacterium dolichotidis]RSX55876.1 two-component system sensor histidine kinase [Bifidobacterium dolichotidis]
MAQLDSEQQGRSSSAQRVERPVGLLSSLRVELSILILISTVLAFLMAWFLTHLHMNGWSALPLTIIVTLIFTYSFARGLTTPLTEMRNAAVSMAEGDYSVRVDTYASNRDEIQELAHAFNEMADELEHADQLRRDMVANVSHELRTPVAALQAMVENMADGVVEPSQSNMENILAQTQRLSDLIAFLLDMSRVEAGAASLHVETFNLAEFIDDTVAPLKIADAGHGHTIELHVPDDIMLEGDKDRLRQLFTNIIANALKHSADNTGILVEARQDDENDEIVANIINYGSEIPAEVRNQIFRRFVKGKSGPGTESGGTGLGLSIARWAAGLHGGTVQVVDDYRGVNFEIRLPRHFVLEEDNPED